MWGVSGAAELRALAARCCTGEATDELRDAVLIALGWSFSARPDRVWSHPDGRSEYASSTALKLLTDLNASAAAMPAGWIVFGIAQRERGGFHVALCKPTHPSEMIVTGAAPTEPLARTAAALMARAAEAEQKEVEV